MRCPVLVGRDAELAAGLELLAGAVAGQGGAAFVVGPAGIGKSALVRSLVAEARSRSVPALIGRSVPGRSPAAFRSLSEAVLSGLRQSSLPASVELSPFRSALSRLVPAWRDEMTPPPEDSPVILGEGLLRLFREIAPPGSLLVLEDLHWADPETLAVVEYLCDNLSSEPIALLATSRDEHLPAVVHALTSRRSAVLLELTALEPMSVAAMISACPLPAGFDVGRGLAVAAAAEGVPLLVEELLSLAADQDPVGRANVPSTVAATVRRRMAQLDPGTRALLICAALLGRDFDWRLAAAAAGLDEARMLAGLAYATELQLLDADGAAFRFRHALTRDAVLADVLPPELSRFAAVTRAAVEVAHPGLPGDWCILAADLAESAGDLDDAAELLVRAGRGALREAALSTAEGVLRRASRLATRAGARLDAGELLTEVLAAAGRVDEAAELARSLLAMGGYGDSRRATLQLRLATAAVAGERWAVALEQLDSVQPLLQGTGFEAEAALNLALSAQVAIGEGRPDEAAGFALSAVDAAATLGLPEVACAALEVIGRVERLRSLPAARAALLKAAALAESAGLVLWQLRALHELGVVDMFATGDLERLEQARGRAAAAGALMTVATIDVQLAGGSWMKGDGEGCLAAAGRAAEAGQRFRVDGLRAIGVFFAGPANALLLDATGLDEAALALAAVGADAELTGAMWGDGRCVHALLTEDRGRALVAVRRAQELTAGVVNPLPSPWWGLWPLLEVLESADTARTDEALERARRTAPVGWNTAMFGYAGAVVLGRAGDPAAAGAAFAAADAAASYWPWWSHLGRRLVAEAALEDGWGEPLTWLAQAATFFDDFPAPAVASACRSLLRRAGASVPAVRTPAGLPTTPLGLTAREVEVLLLVGQGLSNREVAGRLYLSHRTVEKHVEHVARKVGTESRSQLVAYAAGLSGPT